MPNDSIDRRRALSRLGILGAAAATAGASASAIPSVLGSRPTSSCATTADLTVTVLLDEPIATIRPAIYSQFAEHIGGVIYDGIWVGPDSKVANVDGIRAKLVEHVKQLGPVVVRWPGGCFADKYHWRDGIGPPPARPRRFGRWREETESNQFGTHEFIRFCQLCERRAVFRGQRRYRLARGIPAMGRILQRTGRLDVRSPTSARPTGPRALPASATGASATKAGAAAASSFPKIIAANTASSPNGCPSTACPST